MVEYSVNTLVLCGKINEKYLSILIRGGSIRRMTKA